MAYITLWNFARLSGFKQKDLIMDDSHCALVHNKQCRSGWFNTPELCNLYLHKILLLEKGHPLYDKILGERWLYIYTPKDDYRHLKAPKAPAYHLYQDCDAMCSNFEDFELPANFVETYGKHVVDEFREWCQKPRLDGSVPLDFLREGNGKSFVRAVQAKGWGGRGQPLNWEGAVETFLKRENSGIRQFFNLNLDEVGVELDRVMQEYDEWFENLPHTVQKFLKASQKNSYLYEKEKDNELAAGLRKFHKEKDNELDAALRKFHLDFKRPMQALFITEYYRRAEKAGIDDLNGNVLENLGFKLCRCCKQRHDNGEHCAEETVPLEDGLLSLPDQLLR